MKQSAGLLLFRHHQSLLQLFLIHPGGPFFKNKDAGAWSIPKGEFGDNEDPLIAAKRELKEETGFAVEVASAAGLHFLQDSNRPRNDEPFIELKPVKQKGGKIVYAWAIEADVDADKIKSNTFEIEWPPKSGKMKEFPEVDRAGWFSVEEAREKINPAQIGLIDDLIAKLKL